ncbi:unnamed protein product [Pylaiella littoralis]
MLLAAESRRSLPVWWSSKTTPSGDVIYYYSNHVAKSTIWDRPVPFVSPRPTLKENKCSHKSNCKV